MCPIWAPRTSLMLAAAPLKLPFQGSHAMSDYLLLGPVLFQDFELPERITWGGAQRMAIHRLPGGDRVIDSMGRDDADILWSGVFTGPDAGARARLLDLLRADGGVWPLAWSSFAYSVVIARFEADYTKSTWIPYRIACTVLHDEAAALHAVALTLGDDILSDIASAAEVGGGLDFSGPMAALSAPGATVRGTANYAVARTALRDASAGLDLSVANADAQLLSAAMDTAQGLVAAVSAAGDLATTLGSRGYIYRAGRILDGAGT